MIKEKLSEYKISLAEFSKLINLSRPTLNLYISFYESGKNIPNEKYDFVFKKIFSDPMINNKNFLEKVKKYSALLKRDKSYGVFEFDLMETDLVASTFDLMKNDILLGDYNKDIYKFINLLISHYHSDKLFSMVTSYFLYLNGVKDITFITEEEKRFVSNLFGVMGDAKKKQLKFRDELYEQFINRVKEIDKIKKEEGEKKIESKKLEIQDKISTLLEKKLKEKVENGIDISKINIDVLLKEIDLNEIE